MNRKRLFSPTVQQLRAFVAVYKLGKLSAAAQQLFLTQSAVSVLLKNLEEGLEVRLFDRTTRSLQPTVAADEAIKTAERVLQDIDAFSTGFADLANLDRGRCTLVATPMLAEILLPQALKTFRSENPKVQCIINDCAPNQFYSRMLEEQVDFGIGALGSTYPDLQFQTLSRDCLSVICLATSALAKQATVRWGDLDSMPIITVRPGYGIRSLFELSASKAGIRPNVAQEVSFPSTALWMAAQGEAPAVLPASLLAFSRDPSLVARPLTDPEVSRDIYLVFKKGRSLSPAAARFVEILRDIHRQ